MWKAKENKERDGYRNNIANFGIGIRRFMCLCHVEQIKMPKLCIFQHYFLGNDLHNSEMKNIFSIFIRLRLTIKLIYR